jgi:hypothetical protein
MGCPIGLVGTEPRLGWSQELSDRDPVPSLEHLWGDLRYSKLKWQAEGQVGVGTRDETCPSAARSAHADSAESRCGPSFKNGRTGLAEHGETPRASVPGTAWRGVFKPNRSN